MHLANKGSPRSIRQANQASFTNVASVLYVLTIFLVILVCFCGSKYLLKSKCMRKPKNKKNQRRKIPLAKKTLVGGEESTNTEEEEEEECTKVESRKEGSVTSTLLSLNTAKQSQQSQQEVYKFSDTATILLAKCPPESSNKTDLSRLKRAKSVYQIGDRSRYNRRNKIEQQDNSITCEPSM